MALPVAAGAAVAVGWILRSIAVAIVIRVLTAFGVGWALFYGVDLMLDYALGQIQAQINGFGIPEVVVFIGLLKIDYAISLIFAAWALRLGIRGLTQGGTIRKLGFFAAWGTSGN